MESSWLRQFTYVKITWFWRASGGQIGSQNQKSSNNGKKPIFINFDPQFYQCTERRLWMALILAHPIHNSSRLVKVYSSWQQQCRTWSSCSSITTSSNHKMADMTARNGDVRWRNLCVKYLNVKHFSTAYCLTRHRVFWHPVLVPDFDMHLSLIFKSSFSILASIKLIWIK